MMDNKMNNMKGELSNQRIRCNGDDVDNNRFDCTLINKNMGERQLSNVAGFGKGNCKVGVESNNQCNKNGVDNKNNNVGFGLIQKDKRQLGNGVGLGSGGKNNLDVSNRFGSKNNIKHNTGFRLINSCVFGLIVIVMMLSLISGVSALGITPARDSYDFVSGSVVEGRISVINSDKQKIDVIIYAEGELAGSIELSENNLKFEKGEESRSFKYKFKMPSSLSPGLHKVDIVALQLPSKNEKSDAFVGATVAVVSQLYIRVPYPGKYAEAEMHIVSAGVGEDVRFNIPIMSRGDLDLVSVRANIDIYNKLGQKVESFNTDEISINSGERGELVSTWKADVEIGDYLARATLIYDEQTLMLEKQFSVGEKELELQEIRVNNFRLGEIAKMEMLVENKWSEEIENVYTETEVYNEKGDIMAEFKSPTYSIAGFEKKLFVSYWDTGGVRKGEYDTRVFLRYAQSSVENALKLKVSDDSIQAIGLGYVIASRGSKKSGDSSLVMFLIIGLVVLVLINVLWFLVIRKRLKK